MINKIYAKIILKKHSLISIDENYKNFRQTTYVSNSLYSLRYVSINILQENPKITTTAVEVDEKIDRL